MVKNTTRLKTRQSRRDLGGQKRVLTQKGSSGPHSFSIVVAAGHRETTGELRISSYRSSPSWPTSVAVPSRQSSRRYQSHAAKTGNSGHYDRTHNVDLSCVRKKRRSVPLLPPRGDTKLTGDGREELFRLKYVVTRRRGVHATGHAPSFPVYLSLYNIRGSVTLAAKCCVMLR